MQFFKKQKTQPQPSSSALRSTELSLGKKSPTFLPEQDPLDESEDSYDGNFQPGSSNYDDNNRPGVLKGHRPSVDNDELLLSQKNTPSTSRHPPPRSHSIPQSRTFRHSQHLDRPTTSSGADTDEQSLPQRSKRNVFNRSRNRDKENVKLFRHNRSVKGVLPQSQRRPSLQVETVPRNKQPPDTAVAHFSPTVRADHVLVASLSTREFLTQAQYTSESPVTNPSPREPRPFTQSPRSPCNPSVKDLYIPRSNTDTALVERSNRSNAPNELECSGALHPAHLVFDPSTGRAQQPNSELPKPMQDQHHLLRRQLQLDPASIGRLPSRHSLPPSSPLLSRFTQSDPRYKSPSLPESPQRKLLPGMTSSDHSTSLRPQATEACSQETGPGNDTHNGDRASYAQAPPDSRSQAESVDARTSQDADRNATTRNQAKGEDDISEIDMRAVLQKHEEIQTKYSRLKRLYFEKDAQVQNLQNTVANQRMAVSRTVLDDNEYTARFNRLDGAIKDLAFNIRKDWTCVPNWLQDYVNIDAGAKEMMAAGRAVISQWLVDEIFQRLFHPALEPTLSTQLKAIEMSLRRQQVHTFTDEDRENALTRISNWRRTTLDGLSDVLHGKIADDHRTQLVDHLVNKLVASLEMYLRNTPPVDLQNGARMIIENAIGISEKLPLESRDICVDYFMPGSPVTEAYMKVESGGVPALGRSKADPSTALPRSSIDQERAQCSRSSGTTIDETDTSPRDRGSSSPSDSLQTIIKEQQKKKSVFGSLIAKKSGSGNAFSTTAPDPGRLSSAAAPGGRNPNPNPRDDSEKADAPATTSRVRFACFISVDVRSKSPHALVKAPVYLTD